MNQEVGLQIDSDCLVNCTDVAETGLKPGRLGSGAQPPADLDLTCPGLHDFPLTVMN